MKFYFKTVQQYRYQEIKEYEKIINYTINKNLHTENDYKKYINKIIKTKTSGELKVLGVHDKIGDNKRYVCEFINTEYQKLVYKSGLINGKIKDDTLPDLHIGEVYQSNNCGNFEIIEKVKSEIYVCNFILTNTKVKANMANIKKGEVLDPYAPTIYGVACLGKVHVKDYSFEYIRWIGLLKRVYQRNHEIIFPNYIDVKIDSEWLCFENFLVDFKTLLGYEDMILHKEIQFDLDKDMKTNTRLYSKDTTILIPHEINTIININQKTNTTGYCGVSWDKEKNTYQIGVSKLSKRNFIGYDDDLLSGFKLFSKTKKEHLEDVLKDRYLWLNPLIKTMVRKRLEERLNEYE